MGKRSRVWSRVKQSRKTFVVFTVILMLGISLYMQYPLLSRYSQTSSSSSQIKASLSAANGPSEIAEPFEEHVANLESQALTQEQRRKCLTEYQGDMHKDEFDILGDALADVSRRGKLTAAELSFLADDINKQKMHLLNPELTAVPKVKLQKPPRITAVPVRPVRAAPIQPKYDGAVPTSKQPVNLHMLSTTRSLTQLPTSSPTATQTAPSVVQPTALPVVPQISQSSTVRPVRAIHFQRTRSDLLCCLLSGYCRRRQLTVGR